MMSPTVKKHGNGSDRILLQIAQEYREKALKTRGQQSVDFINAATRIETMVKKDLP